MDGFGGTVPNALGEPAIHRGDRATADLGHLGMGNVPLGVELLGR